MLARVGRFIAKCFFLFGEGCSALCGDSRGGARREQPGEAPAWASRYPWEVLEEGACECCGNVPLNERRAVWLSYQFDREYPTPKREWWCSFCIRLHFERAAQGFYSQRAAIAVRSGSGPDGLRAARAEEGGSGASC